MNQTMEEFDYGMARDRHKEIVALLARIAQALERMAGPEATITIEAGGIVCSGHPPRQEGGTE